MKKTFFIVLMIFALHLIFAGSCATGEASFQTKNSFGTTVEFDGGTAFCTYDQDVKAESFSQETTCSFTVKQDDVIYQCEKIKLSSINKDFKLETNCTVILDLRAKKHQGA